MNNRQVKILLIDSYVDYPSKYNNYSINLGLLAISSYCKTKDSSLKFHYFSLMHYSKNEHDLKLEDILQKFNPQLVFVSCITSSVLSASNICKQVKSWNDNIYTVIGGVLPSMAGSVLQKFEYFDIIIKGEGEVLTYNLIQEYKIKGKIKKGLYKSSNVKDIPKIDLNSIENHLPNIESVFFPFEMTRGCNYKCEFCYLRDFHKFYRKKQEEIMLDELAQLRSKGVKNLLITDDFLVLNKDIFSTLSKIRQIFDCNFILETRINALNPNNIELLKSIGTSEIIFGVEHIDKQILIEMNKFKHSINDYEKKIIEICKLIDSFDMLAHPIFMLGWCSETEETLKKQTDFACSVGIIRKVQPFVAFTTLHPGSSFKNKYKSLFSSISTNLNKYIHILPTCIPNSLGNNGLQLLVEAHNRIRIESQMTFRNPTISFQDSIETWDDNSSNPIISEILNY